MLLDTISRAQISKATLNQLMGWFKSHKATLDWGGPEFKYPFTPESFLNDSKLYELTHVCLVNQAEELLAFGQCYERLQCCHLARLVIAPNQRGQGMVARLIQALAEQGKVDFNFFELSLFVMEDNVAARKAYEKLGFEYLVIDPPSDFAHVDWSRILYMRAPLSIVGPK